jgi:hypothetical protein
MLRQFANDHVACFSFHEIPFKETMLVVGAVCIWWNKRGVAQGIIFQWPRKEMMIMTTR